jgi:hypothetical protein
MTLMAMYAVKREMRSRAKRERQVGDRKAWLARAFQLATQPSPFKDRSLTERATLKRLVNAPGYMGR